MSIREFESTYRYLYDDQLISAEEAYLEEFESTFDPDMVDWGDEEEVESMMHSLLNELFESRTDFETLVENAGLSEEDFAKIDWDYEDC